MSYNGHVVIDMDCHLREYWDLDRTYKPHMDPEYRERYELFSEAARARQLRAGDVGYNGMLWPRPMARPMGVYDGFEVERPKSNDGAGSPKSVTGSGKYPKTGRRN